MIPVLFRPVVLPEGTGQVNPAGLDFYDRLIDELLGAGIQPYVTLFHWDYPYALHLRGGWLNRDSVDWFADYAALVAVRLGDRVTYWMTLNEPQIFVWLGYEMPVNAPALKLPPKEVARIVHHVNMAHGRAVQAIRANAALPAHVSIASTGIAPYPARETPDDIEAARRAFAAENHPPSTLMSHPYWLDPMAKGEYFPSVARLLDESGAIHAEDMDVIRQPLDSISLNIYFGNPVEAGEDGQPQTVSFPVGQLVTLVPWPVTPEALYWCPKFVHERYGLPVYITENGLSNPDWVSLDGKVHDPQRIDFVRRYLQAFRRAGEDGVDIRGYFHWSIMDNLEWVSAMKHRFGLIHVDFPTQTRTLKDSAYWYQEVIQTNGANV